MHIERRGDGHRVHYAIADPGAFITPGGALDRETHARAVTVYMPDGKIPLHPPVLSEGAASLLPGQWRPAVLWTLDLDARGELTGTEVRRAEVRSVAQHTYEDERIAAAARGRRAAAGARARARRRAARGAGAGGHPAGRRLDRALPGAARSEEHNAQISLLCGMAAAALMLRRGIGILRTQPRAGRARSGAAAADRRGACRRRGRRSCPIPSSSATLDPTKANHAAVMHEASRVAHGAGYTAFDGTPPADAAHWAVAAPYAHATAPLRRLQDRYVSACCLGESAHGARGAPGRDGRRHPAREHRRARRDRPASRRCCWPAARASASTRS